MVEIIVVALLHVHDSRTHFFPSLMQMRGESAGIFFRATFSKIAQLEKSTRCVRTKTRRKFENAPANYCNQMQLKKRKKMASSGMSREKTHVLNESSGNPIFLGLEGTPSISSTLADVAMSTGFGVGGIFSSAAVSGFSKFVSITQSASSPS